MPRVPKCSRRWAAPATVIHCVGIKNEEELLRNTRRQTLEIITTNLTIELVVYCCYT